MTDQPAPLDGVRRAANELIPRLAERLAQHGLGELEVREGSLRVRVARAPAGSEAPAPPRPTVLPLERISPSAGPSHQGVTSPAVGFFVYADGLGPGLAVEKGDPLGHVEMLGVRHDVRAPRRGLVRNLVTETGEAVEYGQVLIEMEAAE
jgi:biotin carboxyl carrier protein